MKPINSTKKKLKTPNKLNISSHPKQTLNILSWIVTSIFGPLLCIIVSPLFSITLNMWSVIMVETCSVAYTCRCILDSCCWTRISKKIIFISLISMYWKTILFNKQAILPSLSLMYTFWMKVLCFVPIHGNKVTLLCIFQFVIDNQVLSCFLSTSYTKSQKKHQERRLLDNLKYHCWE